MVLHALEREGVVPHGKIKTRHWRSATYSFPILFLLDQCVSDNNLAITDEKNSCRNMSTSFEDLAETKPKVKADRQWGQQINK